jgi:Sec-independent protein translocase protein TatA
LGFAVFPFDLSAVKIVVLLVLGVIIFGPERVPKAITEALGLVRRLKAMGRAGVEELGRELGPDFAGLRPQDLHPKAVLHRALSTTPPGVAGVSDLDRDIRETPHPDQLLAGDAPGADSMADHSPAEPQGSRTLAQLASERGQPTPHTQDPCLTAQSVDPTVQNDTWMSIDEWLRVDPRP